MNNKDYISIGKITNFFGIKGEAKVGYSSENHIKSAKTNLNRKNIMWEDEVPYIIDWETSEVGHPSVDFFNSAFFMSHDVEENKYDAFASS